jgi:hypothetical protein
MKSDQRGVETANSSSPLNSCSCYFVDRPLRCQQTDQTKKEADSREPASESSLINALERAADSELELPR